MFRSLQISHRSSPTEVQSIALEFSEAAKKRFGDGDVEFAGTDRISVSSPKGLPAKLGACILVDAASRSATVTPLLLLLLSSVYSLVLLSSRRCFPQCTR